MSYVKAQVEEAKENIRLLGGILPHEQIEHAKKREAYIAELEARTDTQALKRVRNAVKEVVDNTYVVNLEDSELDKATIRRYADLKEAIAQLNALIGQAEEK
ncbi:MAG: hypothetical protein ACK502_10640 [Alphaproteobacteria bacterium]|jgi:DUF1009 family protein